jgi:hypothetical protein
VNGAVGVVVAPRGRLLIVLGVTVTHGKIVEIDVVADPSAFVSWTWRSSTTEHAKLCPHITDIAGARPTPLGTAEAQPDNPEVGFLTLLRPDSHADGCHPEAFRAARRGPRARQGPLRARVHRRPNDRPCDLRTRPALVRPGGFSTYRGGEAIS